MLDLGKPFGTHHGLECYGDDKDEKTVYYLPDEIKFAKKGEKTDFRLRVFQEQQTSTGGAESIRNSLGSIFEMGVVCDVDPDRLAKAKSSVKSARGLSDDINFRTPIWEDGTVDMVTLDAQKSEGDSGKSDFVRKIVGSKKPSLVNGLDCLFHVSFNQKGTEMAYAALKGDTDCLVGVLYDLKYKASRPAVEMRITAKLDRCQETVQHELDINFNMYYYVDLDLSAQLEWLTKKMEENGDIQVEYFTDVDSDPELKKAADAMLKEFKEAVLKELFEPFPDMDNNTSVTTDPQKASEENFLKQGVDVAKKVAEGKKGKDGGKDGGKGSEAKPGDGKETGQPSSGTGTEDEQAPDPDEDKKDEKPADEKWAEKFQVGIAYRMKSHKIEMNKQLVVDYRERSTTIRTHNPQSHVFFMLDKKENIDSHIEEVRFGQDFTAETLKVQLDYEFTKDNNDLSFVDVCIWRKKDGVDETKEDGFAIPSSAAPLKQFTFNKNAIAPVEINWAPDKPDDLGYYYQLCFHYAPGVKNRYSPEKVLTQPFLSTSEDLIIRPDTYMFYRNYPIRVSDMAFDDISGVDLTVTVNPDSEDAVRELIPLDKNNPSSRFIVRGCDNTDIPVKLEKVFRFADHSKAIETAPEFQSDDEIIICNPIAQKNFTFNLSGGGAGVGNLLLLTTVKSPEYGTELENESIELDAAKATQKQKIPIFSASDVVSYTVQAYANNKWNDLCSGEFSAGTKKPIEIDLSLIGKKKYTLKWTGKSPEENGLQYVSVVLKNGDGEVVHTTTFKGSDVPEPVDFVVAAGTELILTVERKPIGGLPEPGQASMVTSDVIEIKP